MGFPASVELAIWLNQFRSGLISRSDVRNAAETITEDTAFDWQNLIDQVALSQQPCFALLPIPGWTYGLPSQILSQIDVSLGVCVFAGQNLLARLNDKKLAWQTFESTHQIVPPEPKAARLRFTALLEESVAQLARMDAQGDRAVVERQLTHLKVSHLPPALPSRVKSDLDSAQRIWLITEIGAQESKVIHSPSLDEQRFEQLRKLRISAINLMSAVTLTA